MISTSIRKLCRRITTKYKPIMMKCDPPEWATPRWCVGNVYEMVKRHGGKAVFGWLLSPNEDCVEFINHAVWQNPDGNIVDISPSYDGMPDEKIFLRDELAAPEVVRIGEYEREYPLFSRWLTTNPSPQFEKLKADREADQREDYKRRRAIFATAVAFLKSEKMAAQLTQTAA